MNASMPSGCLKVSKAIRVTWTFESYTVCLAHLAHREEEEPYLLTFARRMYSLTSGVAGCSKESRRSVNGDAVSLRLKSFEIRSKLCVCRWDVFIGAMIVQMCSLIALLHASVWVMYVSSRVLQNPSRGCFSGGARRNSQRKFPRPDDRCLSRI